MLSLSFVSGTVLSASCDPILFYSRKAGTQEGKEKAWVLVIYGCVTSGSQFSGLKHLSPHSVCESGILAWLSGSPGSGSHTGCLQVEAGAVVSSQGWTGEGLPPRSLSDCWSLVACWLKPPSCGSWPRGLPHRAAPSTAAGSHQNK